MDRMTTYDLWTPSRPSYQAHPEAVTFPRLSTPLHVLNPPPASQAAIFNSPDHQKYAFSERCHSLNRNEHHDRCRAPHQSPVHSSQVTSLCVSIAGLYIKQAGTREPVHQSATQSLANLHRRSLPSRSDGLLPKPISLSVMNH